MKKLIMLSIATFTSTFFTLNAQGVWSPRAPLPFPDSAMFQGISGFSIGNYGYAGLGEYNHESYNFREFWQFNPSTNSWVKKASFPGKARISPASFVIGNKVYLVTGSVNNGGTCLTECWQYDATTDTWTQKANFPGSPRTYAVGFAIGGKGYVGTGANELTDFRKDFYAYDTATNTWTRIADFLGIARSCASGFAVGGKGYVCFGQDSLFHTDWMNADMWEYDTANNKWTQKSNYPGLPMYCASGFAICSNIYVGSGFDSISGWDNQTFWKYNTILDSWTQEANVPGITKLQGTAFAIGDTGYYGFGIDSNVVVQNAFYKYYAGDSCNVKEGYQTLYNNSEIGIYPNPFSEESNIEMHDISYGVPVFALFNLEGLQQEIKIQGHNTYYKLSRGGLKDGVYILSIEYNNQVFYKKLVIIN